MNQMTTGAFLSDSGKTIRIWVERNQNPDNPRHSRVFRVFELHPHGLWEESGQPCDLKPAGAQGTIVSEGQQKRAMRADGQAQFRRRAVPTIGPRAMKRTARGGIGS